MRSVQHPNVIACYGAQYTPEGQTIHLFLEYASGGSLGDLVKREGALAPVTVRDYSRQIVTALAHLHSMGIIHRSSHRAHPSPLPALMCGGAGT